MKIPSLASLTVRGGELKRFCSESSSALRATLRVNLASPKVCAPRPRRKGESRGRGAEGGDANLPLPPFFLWGELLLLLLVRGEGKYEGAGALHCAPGRYTYSAVVYASRFPYAMHTPSECDGDRTHRSLGLETRPPPPGRTLYDSFLTGESDPVWADGHPIAERVVRRVSGSHKPRPSKKRSPVELPGAVAPTGGCVLCSLLVQDRCVQAVQDGLFGAAFSGALIVLLRAFTRVGLVSSQGISPPSRRELRQ